MEKVSSKRNLTLLKVYQPLSPNSEQVMIFQDQKYLMTLMDFNEPIKEVRVIRLPGTKEEELKFCAIGYLPRSPGSSNPNIFTWYDGKIMGKTSIGSSNLKIVKNKLDDGYTTFMHLQY